jgi:hypothetical protein
VGRPWAEDIIVADDDGDIERETDSDKQRSKLSQKLQPDIDLSHALFVMPTRQLNAARQIDYQMDYSKNRHSFHPIVLIFHLLVFSAMSNSPQHSTMESTKPGSYYQEKESERSWPDLPTGCAIRVYNGEKYILPNFLVPSFESQIAYQEECKRLDIENISSAVSIFLPFSFLSGS